MALTIVVWMYTWTFVFGAIENPLDQFCEGSDDSEKNEQHTWEDVSLDDWYWNNDYNKKVAAGETVYPAGFRNYTLAEFNQPPVCVTVPQSGDKKVEILIETTVEDAHVCIHDASDIGFANNDVGNVDTCGMGLLYACFTAAEAETENNDVEDFSFYVYCKESCEASDVGLWMRVRTSNQTWEAGKTGVADDLEMWCEMEKGTVLNDTNGVEHNYFTYPEDLVPDDPVVYPFRIEQVERNTGSVSDGGSNTLAFALVSVFIVLFFIVAGCCVVKNHEQLPEGCVKFIPCINSNVDDYE